MKSYTKINNIIHQVEQYWILDPPSYEVSILFDNCTLTSKLPSTLREQLYTTPLINTICKTENWSIDTFQKVNWTSYGSAFSSQPWCHRISITKLKHKSLNSNYQNKKYYGKSDTCPCCSLSPEAFNHLLSCPSEITHDHRSTQLENLEMKLQKKTPQPILSALLHGITTWIDQQSDLSIVQRPLTFRSLKPG